MTTFIRILGFLILVGGIVVCVFGYNSSQKLGEKGMEKVTGRYSDGTMKYIIGGVIMVIGGLAVTLNAGRISREK